MRRIHRWPVNSPHKWPVTRKMFPFDDVIMGTTVAEPHATKKIVSPNISVLRLHRIVWWGLMNIGSGPVPVDNGMLYSVENVWLEICHKTMSSLLAPEVVMMTTSGANSDDNVFIMTTIGFQFKLICVCVALSTWPVIDWITLSFFVRNNLVYVCIQRTHILKQWFS